jgi:hypothetical protein
MITTSPQAGQRRKAQSNAQEPGEDQPDRSEHLDDAEKPHEPSRQRRLLREHFEWQDQLYSPGEQEEEREQHLNCPQYICHYPSTSFPAG